MAAVTRNCDQCAYAAHWNDNAGKVHMHCQKGHRPRFYVPRKDNPHGDFGWKRRCEDYQEKAE